MSDSKSVDYVTLRTGDKMPLVGLGTWKIPKETTPSSVQFALQNGYRLLDCASDYGNEAEVGQGIANAIKAGVKRSDFFVTSKLWNTYHEAKYVRRACEKTLSDLGLQYLDLYLIHFPIAQKYVDFDVKYPAGWTSPDDDTKSQFSNATIQETWAEMEKLVSAGLVKNIGICNFSVSLLMQLTRFATIQPAVLQVERHPYLTQPKLVSFCQSKDIKMTAFSSFGGTSYVELGFQGEKGFVQLLEHKAVTDIAASLNKSPAQVLLRWSVQNGIAIIPKSSKESRLVSNAALFDFALSDAEMASLDALNTGRRFNDPGEFCNPPQPIYD